MSTEIQNKRELGRVIPHNFGRSWDIYLVCHKIEKNEGLKKMGFSPTLHKICCVFGQDAEYYFTSNKENVLKFGEVRPKIICNTEKVIVVKRSWNGVINSLNSKNLKAPVFILWLLSRWELGLYIQHDENRRIYLKISN